MTPLVFVHGFMGGSDQWALQAPLAQSREMICVDLPGFGKNAHLQPIDRIDGFELTGELTSWFYVVAKRRALRLRELAGRAQGELEEALVIPDEAEDSTADLRRLLARLPGPQQEVLVLRFLDGWDLSSVTINGGTGLFPRAAGNEWVFTAGSVDTEDGSMGALKARFGE